MACGNHYCFLTLIAKAVSLGVACLSWEDSRLLLIRWNISCLHLKVVEVVYLNAKDNIVMAEIGLVAASVIQIESVGAKLSTSLYAFRIQCALLG